VPTSFVAVEPVEVGRIVAGDQAENPSKLNSLDGITFVTVLQCLCRAPMDRNPALESLP
jgi:hypothetical protein